MNFFGTEILGLSSAKALDVKFERPPFNLPPIELYSRIQKHSKASFIFDSVVGPEKLAEYSFIGCDPIIVMRAKNGTFRVEDREGKVIKEMKTKDPLNEVRGLLGGLTVGERRFRYLGGGVGYVSYDSIRYWEKLPERTRDDLAFPDLELGFFLDGFIFDHRKGESLYFYSGESRLGQLAKHALDDTKEEGLQVEEAGGTVNKDEHREMVMQAKSHIEAGDIFQAVLSRREDYRIDGDLLRFYKALMKVNPSPYMYYIEMGDRKIAGSSPEMLVRVEGRTVQTFPIAGTRPRGADPETNRRLRDDLISDPKERAEHVMLVDLGRNDVGRVSRYGTLRVPEFMTVHDFSHVQHIVSKVEGELAEDRDSFDALRAIFPAGTVSGAPKVRAMEIIEDLEPSRRGPYAGAVGYFSLNGNADFAITIRTLTYNGETASIQMGGGIVADSLPENEWQETVNKGAAMKSALRIAAGGKA